MTAPKSGPSPDLPLRRDREANTREVKRRVGQQKPTKQPREERQVHAGQGSRPKPDGCRCHQEKRPYSQEDGASVAANHGLPEVRYERRDDQERHGGRQIERRCQQAQTHSREAKSDDALRGSRE